MVIATAEGSDYSLPRSETKCAIVIGINHYENKTIPQLQGAENDAIELEKTLTSPALGFKVDHGHFLLDEEATHKRISKTVSELFRKNTDQSLDLILFYFSGHGFMDEETKMGYIAPYDMDPDDPEFCGIRMEDLRRAAFASKNKANILIVLDCCYAGIATKGTKGSTAATKHIYAAEVEAPLLQDQNVGKSRLLIASSEADEVSREKTDCEHLNYPSPHTHGVFSFHLLQGLEGGAADKLGLITFESIQKYLEIQVVAEGKQRPLHSSVDESYRLDKIRIGESPDVVKKNIAEFVREAKEYSCKTDLRSLRIAAQNIRDLQGLKFDNAEIPGLIQNVNNAIKNIKAQGLIGNWLRRHEEFFKIPAAIEQISTGLYDKIFYGFAENLSYDKLQLIDNTEFRYLNVLFNEARSNTTYATIDNPGFITLVNRLKEISQGDRQPSVA